MQTKSMKQYSQEWLAHQKYKRSLRDKARRQLPILLNRQSGKCAYCKCDLSVSGVHVDHVEPLATGGTNEISNLRAVCPSCNHAKGAKTLAEFVNENS